LPPRSVDWTRSSSPEASTKKRHSSAREAAPTSGEGLRAQRTRKPTIIATLSIGAIVVPVGVNTPYRRTDLQLISGSVMLRALTVASALVE
jgi:hypothetical protein